MAITITVTKADRLAADRLFTVLPAIYLSAHNHNIISIAFARHRAKALEDAAAIFEAVVMRGYPRTLTGKCPHGVFYLEDCVACYDEELMDAVTAVRNLGDPE